MIKYIIYTLSLLFIFTLCNYSDIYAVRNRKMNPYELYSLGSSDISPSGKLAQMFILGSDYTDLQREDVLNEIKNKIISWNLPVYEVRRNGQGSYIVVTQGSQNVIPCVIYLETFSDSQDKFVHSLKTGSRIPIKGLITGETDFRRLVIKPAVLLDK